MTDAWDGRPENPERDGWHWLHVGKPEDGPVITPWSKDNQGWVCGYIIFSPDTVASFGWSYLTPCHTPAEVAAREAAAYQRGLVQPRGVYVAQELSDAAIDAVRKQLGKYGNVPHIDNAVRSAICSAYQRGQEDMRERAAGLLNYHATRLRKEDEDNRGIPNGMGHSFEANAGDAWADGIRALTIKEAPDAE